MSKRVLVVEPDYETGTRITTALRRLHYEVLAVTRGRQALAAIHAPVQPDLVILEPMMEEISGWEVLATLDASPMLLRIPVLILTVLPDVASPHGRPVLHKPFTLEQLAHAAEALCPSGSHPSAPCSSRLPPMRPSCTSVPEA